MASSDVILCGECEKPIHKVDSRYGYTHTHSGFPYCDNGVGPATPKVNNHVCAAELEAIYRYKQAEAAEAEKAWHDALVRECGFQVGDRVRSLVGRREEHTVFEVEYFQGEVLARMDYEYGPWYLAFDLQRIDQDGNPLPDRTALE